MMPFPIGPFVTRLVVVTSLVLCHVTRALALEKEVTIADIIANPTKFDEKALACARDLCEPCWCHPLCQVYGNCCPGYVEWTTSPSVKIASCYELSPRSPARYLVDVCSDGSDCPGNIISEMAQDLMEGHPGTNPFNRDAVKPKGPFDTSGAVDISHMDEIAKTKLGFTAARPRERTSESEDGKTLDKIGTDRVGSKSDKPARTMSDKVPLDTSDASSDTAEISNRLPPMTRDKTPNFQKTPSNDEKTPSQVQVSGTVDTSDRLRPISREMLSNMVDVSTDNDGETKNGLPPKTRDIPGFRGPTITPTGPNKDTQTFGFISLHSSINYITKQCGICNGEDEKKLVSCSLSKCGDGPTPTCDKTAVDQCSDDGKERYCSKELEYVIYGMVGNGGKIFKNEECARCNHVTQFKRHNMCHRGMLGLPTRNTFAKPFCGGYELQGVCYRFHCKDGYSAVDEYKCLPKFDEYKIVFTPVCADCVKRTLEELKDIPDVSAGPILNLRHYSTVVLMTKKPTESLYNLLEVMRTEFDKKSVRIHQRFVQFSDEGAEIDETDKSDCVEDIVALSDDLKLPEDMFLYRLQVDSKNGDILTFNRQYCNRLAHEDCKFVVVPSNRVKAELDSKGIDYVESMGDVFLCASDLANMLNKDAEMRSRIGIASRMAGVSDTDLSRDASSRMADLVPGSGVSKSDVSKSDFFRSADSEKRVQVPPTTTTTTTTTTVKPIYTRYVYENERPFEYIRFKEPESDNKSEEIVTVVGLVFSLLSLFCTAIIYIYNGHIKKTPGKIVFSFCICLFLAQLLFIFLDINFPYFFMCKAIAILDHFFWLSSFSWSSIMLLDLVRVIANAETPSLQRDVFKSYPFYSVLAWLTPLAIIVTCICLDQMGAGDDAKIVQYGIEGFCWIHHAYAQIYAFGTPIAVSIIVNILFLVRIFIAFYHLRINTRTLGNSATLSHRRSAIISLKLVSVMGLTWILGFAGSITDLTALMYMFSLVNSFQGVYVFLGFAYDHGKVISWIKTRFKGGDDKITENVTVQSTAQSTTTPREESKAFPEDSTKF